MAAINASTLLFLPDGLLNASKFQRPHCRGGKQGSKDKVIGWRHDSEWHVFLEVESNLKATPTSAKNNNAFIQPKGRLANRCGFKNRSIHREMKSSNELQESYQCSNDRNAFIPHGTELKVGRAMKKTRMIQKN
jgi:hypothetical protein